MEPNLENVSNEIVNASTSTPTPAPAPVKPAKSKGLVAATVIFAILAIAGIAGAVYFYMDANNKAAEKAELQAKLDLVEVETATNSTPTTTVEITNESGPFIQDGYFYVPEWGWKFKIPEDLAGLGFAVDYDEAHVGYDLPFIGFTAVQKSDLLPDAQAEYYDDILSCSIISVNKTLKSSDNYVAYTLMGDDIETDDYVLYISDYPSSSLGNYCTYNTNTEQVSEKLKTMFQNPESI